MIKCPTCGLEVEAGTKFCGSCGTDLSSVSATPAQQTQTEQTASPFVSSEQTPVATPTVTTEQTPVTQTPVMQDQSMQYNPMPNQSVAYNQPGLNAPAPKGKGKGAAIVIGIIAALLVVGAIIGVIFLLPDSETKKEKEQIENIFDPDKLIRVRKDNKYGFIDAKGKFVLEPTYSYAEHFHGDYTVVRAEVEINGMTTSAYQIIDTKGKVIKQGSKSIEYIDELDMWLVDQELYNNKMKKVSPEGAKVEEADDGYFVWVNATKKTGGIMNSKGKVTYTYQFQGTENYISIDPSSIDDSLKQRYCRINIENDKYSIVNCDTGFVIQEFTPKYISVSSDNIFEINKLESRYEDESRIYIQDDKIAFKTDDPSKVSIYHYPGYLSITDRNKSYSEGRYSYLHLDTLEIKDERPASKDDDKEKDEWEEYTGISKLEQSYKYGLTDGEKIVLPAEWDSLSYVDLNLYKYLKSNKKDYIYGKKDSNWYIIDLSTKKPIREFKTNYIYQEEDTSFMYYTDKESNLKVVYNILSNKTITVPKGGSFSAYSNYATIKDSTENVIRYYNTNLEVIYTEGL